MADTAGPKLCGHTSSLLATEETAVSAECLKVPLYAPCRPSQEHSSFQRRHDDWWTEYAQQQTCDVDAVSSCLLT